MAHYYVRVLTKNQSGHVVHEGNWMRDDEASKFIDDLNLLAGEYTEREERTEEEHHKALKDAPKGDLPWTHKTPWKH